MGYENRSAEGNGSSNATPPFGDVEKLAESVEMSPPRMEDESVNEFMKKVESIGNAAKINDWLWQIAGGRAKQTEKK